MLYIGQQDTFQEGEFGLSPFRHHIQAEKVQIIVVGGVGVGGFATHHILENSCFAPIVVVHHQDTMVSDVSNLALRLLKESTYQIEMLTSEYHQQFNERYYVDSHLYLRHKNLLKGRQNQNPRRIWWYRNHQRK